MAKNNNAPDRHIQEQNEQLTSQKILRQVNDLCDNLTRQFNNAMEYQNDPVRVVPAEDVHKAVQVEMRFPARYQQAIEQLNSGLTEYNKRINELRIQLSDLNTRYSNLCNAYSKMADTTLENEILRESNLALGKKLEDAQIRGWKRLWKDLRRGIGILFTKKGAKTDSMHCTVIDIRRNGYCNQLLLLPWCRCVCERGISDRCCPGI